ncbi:pyrroloquinoline quinone biosynthesis protein PqqB [Beijerinckia sp. L45]|uniref:pyrroloquinoline quinone biosynthesis protein PqqB n=1 Tax=Beijerinckia sp. L45 TaxID=1641855 RepID=UPI00131ECEF1|nr:pyrroloquinoline quinone biosynthesis protein PqqB [Beijerinckia sp. L45]
MKAIILGSAAGGGVPQWNCRCSICQLARAGDPRVLPRTQSSLAISEDGESWLLVNASPDIRQQLSATPELHPQYSARHSPIAAVLLTNGDVDHVAGLLTLRESTPFRLYATTSVRQAVDANRIFGVCAPALVPRLSVTMGDMFQPVPGLDVEMFAVPGKVALWLEDDSMKIGEATENTVGLQISAGGKRLLYIPGCAAVTEALQARISGADVVLFDGTMWTDTEMVEAGLGSKTARRMGHIPLSGEDGSIERLRDVPVARRVFVHINNTNPILVDGSAERMAAEASGWEVGYDGMRITL